MKPYHSELILDGIILNANESPVEPPKKVVDEIKKNAKHIASDCFAFFRF